MTEPKNAVASDPPDSIYGTRYALLKIPIARDGCSCGCPQCDLNRAKFFQKYESQYDLDYLKAIFYACDDSNQVEAEQVLLAGGIFEESRQNEYMRAYLDFVANLAK